MNNKNIAVINLNISNLGSITRALKKLNYKSIVTNEIKDLNNSSHIIFPGVGSFDKGVFFKIPFDVFGQKSLNSYGWKPLTKDPGSKLNKPYELYNELIRFNL